MSIAVVIAAALSQTTASMVVMAPHSAPIEVGYEELVDGRPEAAIQRIEARPALRRDPVALINSGTAHARLGEIQVARQKFRAAMRSDERYDVELQDGRIMDSREAARLAIGRLDLASR